MGNNLTPVTPDSDEPQLASMDRVSKLVLLHEQGVDLSKLSATEVSENDSRIVELLADAKDQKTKGSRVTAFWNLLKALTLLCTTFLLVHVVGGSLQEQAQRRTLVFEARLEMMQQAVSELNDIELALLASNDQIASGDLLLPSEQRRYADFLGDQRERLSHVETRLPAVGFGQDSEAVKNLRAMVAVLRTAELDALELTADEAIDGALARFTRIEIVTLRTVRNEVGSAMQLFLTP